MINHITEKYDPTEVVVIYSNKERHNQYLELHSVINGTLSEGRPLKKKTLYDLIKASADRSEVQLPFKGIVPENILWYNCNGDRPALVWYEPPCLKNLLFKQNKLKNGNAHLPGVIFKYGEGSLKVYAVKENSRKDLNEDSVLYHLPLPNLYENNSVCMGNVDMDFFDKILCVEDIMELCSRNFWVSNFTEFHHKAPLKKTNVYDFWEKQLKEQLPFDLEVLLETKKKLKELCKK